LAKIDEVGEELKLLVLIGGVNYYRQVFDMKTITEAGHNVVQSWLGSAHAAGI
jgi:kynureninase